LLRTPGSCRQRHAPPARKAKRRSYPSRESEAVAAPERRGANIDGEQPIELLNGGIFDGSGFRDPSISDKNIEAIADDIAGEFRKLVRPISRRQIGRDYVTAAASFADLGDDTIGFSRATAVMDENLRTGGGEGEGARATDAAGSAGDECGFSGEVGHDRLPCCLMGLDI
jgi:hypothetical protein